MSDSLLPYGLYLAHQAPLSMGFFRQEYWSGLPCPPPEDLPDPQIKPESLLSPALAGGYFTTAHHLGNPKSRKPRTLLLSPGEKRFGVVPSQGQGP